MDNVVSVLIPAQDFDLDKSAVYMPVTVFGKPIGFISGITEKAVTVCLWTKDWTVMQDLDGNTLQIEIMDPSVRGEGINMEGEDFSEE